MKQTKNNREMIFYVLALTASLALAIIFFSFPDQFLPDGGSALPATGSVRLIEVNQETVKNLGELKQCGDWPVNQVSPSADRGNPFVRKQSSEPIMMATSAVQCLNAIRN